MTPGELPINDDRLYREPVNLYKGKGIMPAQFLEENQIPYCAGAAIVCVYKYRFSQKWQSLNHAQNYLDMAYAYYVTPASRHHEWRITPEEFLGSNDITGTEREIILAISGVFDEGKKAYQKARKLITKLLSTL